MINPNPLLTQSSCVWSDYTLHIIHTQTSVLSLLVSTSCCFVAVSNGNRSTSSGFLNSPRPQLPASDSNTSQWLSPSSSLTHQPTNYQ
jgi:hypothetical protein